VIVLSLYRGAVDGVITLSAHLSKPNERREEENARKEALSPHIDQLTCATE